MLRKLYSIPLLFFIVKTGTHLALATRYGIHRDELYFIEGGLHPDLGYVDHAPLVPWLAGLMWTLSESLFVLRFPAAVAGGLAIVLTILLVREMGGGRSAEIIAGLCMLFAPALLRMGGLLHLPVFGVLFWTAGAYLLTRMAKGGSPRLWLLMGALAGVGLLNKHTMAIFGLGLVAVLVSTPLRAHLRTPWPWLGGLLSLAIFAPNVFWQAQNNWPTLEFIANMRGRTYAKIGTAGFLAGQVLYMHPLSLLIWSAGLFTLLFGALKQFRALAIVFLTVQVFFIFTGGKPYYTAGVFPGVLAAGAIAWERLLTGNAAYPRLRPAIFALLLTLGGAALLPASLPIIPLKQMDKFVVAVTGAVIKSPEDLTGDFHDQYGWREMARLIENIHAKLPATERDHALVLARNYGQASAVNILGSGRVRAVSGHMSYHLWGLEHRAPKKSPLEQTRDIRFTAIAIGLPRALLDLAFGDVRPAGRTSQPLARAKEYNQIVYVCRDPRMSRSELRSAMKQYGFGLVSARFAGENKQ